MVSNLASSLAKAASELKKEGHSQGLPDATAVARAVEQALQKHFGMPDQFGLPTLMSACACVDMSLVLTASACLLCSALHGLHHCWRIAADISGVAQY